MKLKKITATFTFSRTIEFYASSEQDAENMFAEGVFDEQIADDMRDGEGVLNISYKAEDAEV